MKTDVIFELYNVKWLTPEVMLTKYNTAQWTYHLHWLEQSSLFLSDLFSVLCLFTAVFLLAFFPSSLTLLKKKKKTHISYHTKLVFFLIYFQQGLKNKCISSNNWLLECTIYICPLKEKTLKPYIDWYMIYFVCLLIVQLNNNSNFTSDWKHIILSLHLHHWIKKAYNPDILHIITGIKQCIPWYVGFCFKKKKLWKLSELTHQLDPLR